jgi:hypothetical protein
MMWVLIGIAVLFFALLVYREWSQDPSPAAAPDRGSPSVVPSG